MNILGVSAFYHDSAACLVQDGEIIAAAQEERFTRKKHDLSFPRNAIDFCLKEAGLTAKDIDIISFYEKPFLKFERILQTYLQYAPFGFRSFIRAIPLWIKQKLWIKELIRKELSYDGKIIFPEHHEAHAASAFFPSPFKEAAFLTLDGVGEWTTASYGAGKNNKVTIDAEIHFPHSIGLLYSAFTYYTGFKVNSGEYKVMGLAPYGKPKYKDLILSELIDLFDYCAGLTMTNRKFNKLFGGKPRKPETLITQKEMDLAHSIQDVVEEIVLRMTRHIHKTTKQKNFCLAGGVALNCVANGRILREGPFENIWIQPAAGDAGGALGAALFAWHQYLDKPRKIVEGRDSQKGSYLGPSFPNEYIEEYLKDNNIPYAKLGDNELSGKMADLINDQKVIGWFQGRMEFGPRALGARSIIGDARSPKMQKIMNLKIKLRESFRPFAPTVIKENASEYFEIDVESPYMLLVAQVRDATRSSIPAVTHVDSSARVQTVNSEGNTAFHRMISALNEKFGCPVVINTSFNVRGEPIVCTPEDAFNCFMKTNMDYLVMGNCLLDKSKQKTAKTYEIDRNTLELD
jgi:carbamoyltransferase